MLNESKLVKVFAPWDNKYGTNVSIHWYILNDGVDPSTLSEEDFNEGRLDGLGTKVATTVYHRSSNSITVSRFDENYAPLTYWAKATAELVIDEDTRKILCEAMGVDAFDFMPVWCKQTKKHYSC
jgi:hypothetical protein